MHRRSISFLLIVVLIVSLTACAGDKREASEKGDIISPIPQEGTAELTILMNAIEYEAVRTDFFTDYIDKFQKDFGVKINFERIGTDANGLITPNEQDDYIKKLAPKLSVKDGPELIFTQYMSMDALIKQQAVMDLRGKIANLNKVYDKLLGDRAYYIPIGIVYYSQKIKKDALVELGIKEPALNWSARDYYDIRDKYISKNKILFNGYEYYRVFKQFIDINSLYKAGDKKVVINTPQVIQKINDIRSYLFGGKYQLPEGYKYENYYNMIFEDKSEEFEKSFSYYEINNDNGHIDGGIWANLFRAKSMDTNNNRYGAMMYPQFSDREIIMDSYGFLVNKNGKNLDLAYEFIKGLLNDEVQMSMFKTEGMFYPVNKEIEAAILKLEADEELDPKVVQVKEYALQELADGRCKLWITLDHSFYKISTMLDKDLAKFILADTPYDDVELNVELQKLEDKYNIWLNE